MLIADSLHCTTHPTTHGGLISQLAGMAVMQQGLILSSTWIKVQWGVTAHCVAGGHVGWSTATWVTLSATSVLNSPLCSGMHICCPPTSVVHLHESWRTNAKFEQHGLCHIAHVLFLLLCNVLFMSQTIKLCVCLGNSVQKTDLRAGRYKHYGPILLRIYNFLMANVLHIHATIWPSDNLPTC